LKGRTYRVERTIDVQEGLEPLADLVEAGGTSVHDRATRKPRSIASPRLYFAPSVAVYLTFGIILIIVGLMTITTLLDIRSKRHDEELALEDRSRVLATAASNTLAGSLRTRDVETLNELARVIWGQADVAYVKVYDAKGELLLGPGPDQFPPAGIFDQSVPESIRGFQTRVEPEPGLLKVTTPSLAAAEVVGFIQFGLSTDRIDDEINALTVSRVKTTLVLTAVGAVSSVLLATFFMQPIRRLVRATEDLAGGRLETRLDPLRGREMRELGESFNRMADELQMMIRELEASRLRIVTGQESVRREIATHLHGSVQGSLLAMKVDLDEVATNSELDKETAERLENISRALAEVAQNEIANVSRRLYPTIIRRGLVTSLQSLFDRFESSLSLKVSIDDFLKPGGEMSTAVPEQTRLAAYRIADEALTNVVKHAPRSIVFIEVQLKSNCVILTIRDEGPGFDPGAAVGGLGLTTMQDHAGAVGGQATVMSIPGEGTEVQARLPIQS
jgi:signal transduction histidine kinase